MARRYRPRKLFKFWLYHDLTEDVRLMEYIKYLHKTHQFATMVRNGLRLMWTLGQGDLSVLFELFPTLQSQFKPDNSALIEDFRQLLQAQGIAIPQLAQGQPSTNSGQALPAPRVVIPLIDDEEDTIIIKKDENSNAQGAANFFNSLFALSGKERGEKWTVDDFADAPSGYAADYPDDTPPAPRKLIAVIDDDDPPVPALDAGSFKLNKLA